MKKTLLLLTIISLSLLASAKPTVNDKVLKVFQDAFPAAQNARWFDNENYYEVAFDAEEVKCRLRYDHDGKILSTTRYYNAKMVAPFLKVKLTQKFPGKNIYGVTEITSENELSFHFVLEDDKSWIHVKSDGTGQMEVTDKFKKA